MPGFGSNAILGISRQNSFGTAINSWYKMPFASHDFNYTYGELTDDSIQGTPDEPDRVTGIAGLTGTITANVNPLVTGHLLRAAFGVFTTVTSESYYTHRFDPSTGPFDSNCSERPMSFYVDQGEAGVNSAYLLSDCFVNNVEFSLSAGGYLRGSYAIVGKNAALVQKTTDIVDLGPAARPFLWSSTSISLGGAAVQRFTDIRIAFNNNLGTQDRIAGAKAHTYFFRDGFRQFARLSGTMDMAMEDWLRVKNETELAFVMYCKGASNVTSGYDEYFKIDIPRLVLTSHPIGVSGAGMVTVGVEGRGMYLASSKTVATIFLANTVADTIY
jgi:hypothetical protein